jgi:hypothetical protein
MITEKRTKTINGREIEYLDVVHHTTRTKFKMWDRIKILLGKEVVTESELFTQHEHCLVVGSEAKSYVIRLIPRKSKGMMSMAEPLNFQK